MYAIVMVALMYMVAYEGFVYCSIFLLFNRVTSRHCCMSLYMEFDYIVYWFALQEWQLTSLCVVSEEIRQARCS